MRLTDFAYASDADYLGLKEQIDSLEENSTYTFNDCTLPMGCSPSKVTVGLYKKQSDYSLYFDKPVQYTGDNESFIHLCEGEHLTFKSFSKLQDFLLGLTPEAINPKSQADIVESIPDLPKVTQSTLSEETLKHELEKHIIGQDTAITTLSNQVALHLKKTNPKKPLSILAYGHPGCGKSESAKVLSQILASQGVNEYVTVWTELNTFTEAHSVYRLIGSPPGYIGYDDTPVFEAVTHNPYTVFIFDELDKAHPSVLNTFMSILDEGRCASRKELASGKREFDFHRCIFIFTSNFNLNFASDERENDTSLVNKITDISYQEEAVEVTYNEPAEEPIETVQSIYEKSESARRAFVQAGVLKEIASRFNCFVEFQDLSNEAKVHILAKQIIETGLEYGVRLAHISTSILSFLMEASMAVDALTVRSFKNVIEGYLAVAFSEATDNYPNQPVRLEGDIKYPQILPHQTD